MSPITYQSLRAEIEAYYQPPLRRKSTLAKMRTVLREFGDLPGVELSTDVTAAAIRAWLAKYPDRAPMTQRSYLSALRAALRLSRKAGWIDFNPFELRTVCDWVPFAAFDEEDEEPGSRRHCSIAEICRLLCLLDREAREGGWPAWRLQALVYTYVHTGLRKSEALGLRVSDYRDGVFRVRGNSRRDLKTRSSRRVVGASPELVTVLDWWIPRCGSSEWLFPGVIRRGPWLGGSPGYRPLDQVRAAGERAGIEGLTIHSLRRSIATHARRLGLTRDDVQDLLGHADVETQDDWYREQDAENARELARRIRFRPPTPFADGQAPPPA